MTTQSFAGTTYRSETSKHRDLVAPYCSGYGLDVGFGGDPVNDVAIRMDLPMPYARTGDLPVQLGGDCRDLRWFRDDVLDFVYSSHVLEDFPERQTERVLREWARVLRPGGNLVLLLPDQKRYVRYCEANGLGPNAHHSIEGFSLDYVLQVAQLIGGLQCVVRHDQVDDYSFVLVLRKTAPSSGDTAAMQELRRSLSAAWEEQDLLKLRLHQCDQRLRRLQQSFLVRVLRKLRLAPRS